jgi:hypothetical protein
MKQKFKITVDIIMLVLLPILMAFQITGDVLHEWLGATMLVLFIAHNILNIKWYKSIFKGKYTPIRILHTIVNICLLAAMLCLMCSGIIMSSHVFPFLSAGHGMAAARPVHLSAAYWGFVFMSVHLGLHWSGVTSKMKSKKTIYIFRTAAVIIAVFGVICFFKNNIASYMFLRNQFAFFDYGVNKILFFFQLLAMIELWAFIGYYLKKSIRKILYLKH